MKKLIVLSVVFALVAGVAFAADISVDVIGKFVPLAGDSVEDSQVQTGGGMGRLRIGAEGQNEEGTIGGWIRFDANPSYAGWGIANTYEKGIVPSGFVWWKPIEQVKIQFGSNPDGHWGIDGVTRWGFYQVAGDVRVADEGWLFSSSFFGGVGALGAYISITPIEGLEINLHLPFAAGGGDAKEVYKKTVAQIAYNISNIGKFGFTFAGGPGEEFKAAKDWIGGAEVETGFIESDGSKLWAYFGITAIENLGLDIGIGYTTPVTVDYGVDVTYNAPIAVGIGVSYSADAFGIKARFQGEFGGKVSVDAAGADDYKIPAVIIADILPTYTVNDKLSVSLDAGLKITTALDDDSAAAANSVGIGTAALSDKAIVGWHVMPYVGIKAHSWAPSVYIGLRLESNGIKYADGGKKTVTNWSVPIGMIFQF